MGSEFTKEDIIAFYQFSDIVRDQEEWNERNREALFEEKKEEWDNPYYGFPQLLRFAFVPSKSARALLDSFKDKGITYAFSELLKPESIKKDTADSSHKKFKHEKEVLELFETIDGSNDDDELLSFLDYDKIKEGRMCQHIVCVLPYCASCDALEALIQNNAGKFRNLQDYTIINISGVESPNEYKNVQAVKNKIKKCAKEGRKTLTLTVNRMLTGSTVEEWDTMIFLKDTASPQEYDQAIFRLQNQYIKEYTGPEGDVRKINMKPQTLLVDLDPHRMFMMQEQKSQIYNANTDASGNEHLRDRLEEELRISPIITLNKNRIERVEAADILDEIRNYSSSRGVRDEAFDIPIDMSLLGFDVIRTVIEQQAEIGSKQGLSMEAHKGTETDYDAPESNDSSGETFDEESQSTDEENNTAGSSGSDKDDNSKLENRFRTYYSRILFFAFLTKSPVTSLEKIIACFDDGENPRIAGNLRLNKEVLMQINEHMNIFILRKLDYKIQNINTLAHDDSVEPLQRASNAMRKFGRISEAEITTPESVVDYMVSEFPDECFTDLVNKDARILDIASKMGEFAIAVVKRCKELNIPVSWISDKIVSIPTSSIAYEFTYNIYECLGLDTSCIAGNFTSYDLLNVKNDAGKINYLKIKSILSQNKPMSQIRLDDNCENQQEKDKVKFSYVIGNPPYQEETKDTSDKPVYNYFMDAAYEVADKVELIHPARFLFNAGKTPKAWNKKMLNDPHFKVEFFEHNSDKIFPNTEIKGGIAITYRDAGKDFGAIGVFTHFAELRTIIEKVVRNDNCYLDRWIYAPESYKLTDMLHSDVPNVEKLLSEGHKYDVTTNIFEKLDGIAFFDEKKDTYVGIYGLLKGTRCTKYIKKDYIKAPDNFMKWKVFLPKSNGSGAIGEVLSTPLVGEPLVGHTQSFISIGSLDTEYEAKALLKYIKTKFSRTMLGILKVTQDNKKGVWKYVPLQDFTESSDIDWSKSVHEIDQQLYRKYGLDEKEIEFIETHVKKME